MESYDVIVVGAGHNALVSAAYLAAGGLRVMVLEGQQRPGGDAMTEELTLPGFFHDSCASAHTIIQNTPIIRQDELGLLRFGLHYIKPDPVYVLPFGDGESLTMFADGERTAADIARFSAHDAQAYHDLLCDWETLRPLQSRERNQAPINLALSDGLWASGAMGREGLRIKNASAVEIIQERFGNPYVRAFIAWVAMMTIDSIDRPGTGVLPFSLTAGRQQNSWTTPIGGSASLPQSLIRVIEAFGGEVRTNQWIDTFLTDGERVVGVRSRSGDAYYADKAVLSSAHITQLPQQLGQALDAGDRDAMVRWRAGLCMFVTHYAVDTLPLYRTHQGPQASVAMGVLDSLEHLEEILSQFRQGQTSLDQPFIRHQFVVCRSHPCSQRDAHLKAGQYSAIRPGWRPGTLGYHQGRRVRIRPRYLSQPYHQP